MLLWPATVISKEVGGKATDSAIGFASGVIGGLTAFPGALPTMWCDLRGLPKDAKRGLTQPFIGNMQFFGFLLVMLHGDFSADMGWKLVWALPGLIVGTVLGLAAFGKINDLLFSPDYIVTVNGFRRFTYLIPVSPEIYTLEAAGHVAEPILDYRASSREHGGGIMERQPARYGWRTRHDVFRSRASHPTCLHSFDRGTALV